MLLLDGVDPLGQYRPFCDPCGDKLANSALTLGQARRLAEGHARLYGHTVRIEPWDSFQLIEAVTPAGAWQNAGVAPDAPEADTDALAAHHRAHGPDPAECPLCGDVRSRRGR